MVLFDKEKGSLNSITEEQSLHQIALLTNQASAKLVVIRGEMSVRNYSLAQQLIQEHAQLLNQIKQLKEEMAG